MREGEENTLDESDAWFDSGTYAVELAQYNYDVCCRYKLSAHFFQSLH
jgi:hypothetical protein